MKGNILIIILKCSFCLAQTGNELYSEAVGKIQNERWDEAYPILNRLEYFGSCNEISDSLYYHTTLLKARVADKLHLRKASVASYNKADSIITSSGNDSIAWQVRIEKINYLISSDEIENSWIELNSYHALLKPESVNYELKVLEAITALLLNNDTVALNQLELLKPEDTTLIRIKFQEYSNILKKYNPTKIKRLSYFFPGLGQFKLKKYGSALNSLILVGVISTIGIYYVTAYTLLDGVLVAFPFFTRYYIGGAIRAEAFAHDKIQCVKKQLIREIGRILIDK